MNSQLLLLDAHAHYHQCFDRNEFLEKVFENFAKIANLINNKKKWIGILFLTEIKEDIFFSTLKNRSGIIDSNRYRIKETSEDTSIIISS
ncbi:MAG: hypothetical protein KDC90_13010, partial [Ignavibacteriae bacterium]|nr:hypothetical protein [Ignavibacteriota bacterium]